MTKPKNHTIRLTDTQWAAWQVEAKKRGYSGPNAIMAAIADGGLPIGLESPKLNTYAERLVRLDGEISGIWNAIEVGNSESTYRVTIRVEEV